MYLEPAAKRRGAWLHRQRRSNVLESGTAGCPGPVGFDGFRDRDLLGRVGSVSSGRFAIGRGWCRRDRAGLGRKAQLIDAAQQGSAFGVLLPWPPADCVYSCSVSFSSCYGFAGLRLHPSFVLPPALLVTGIASPVEHLLRSLRLRQKRSPPRQR